MKNLLTVSELFETRRFILTYNDSEFERPSSIAELKKCENAVLGSRVGPNLYELLLEDERGNLRSYLASKLVIRHPSGGGSMHVIEVY